jgi:hypothetical protein
LSMRGSDILTKKGSHKSWLPFFFD